MDRFVAVYLDLSPKNQKPVELEHFHVYVINVVILFLECLRYMLFSYLLNSLNYFAGFGAYLVECVLYSL